MGERSGRESLSAVASKSTLPCVCGTATWLLLFAMGSGCASDPEADGSNGLEGIGGSGGSGGDGSAGAVDGEGGVGGQGTFEPPVNAYPSCLLELFASCGTDSACAAESTDAGLTTQLCFTSGARAEYTQRPTCTDEGGGSEVRVTKPDGSLCFTYVISNVSRRSACENGTLTWTNAAGEMVATGNYGFGIGYGETISCAGSGDSTSCRNPCRPRPSGRFSSVTCTAGTCP